MLDSEEENLCLIKLVSGEEIVAMTSSIEDDNIKIIDMRNNNDLFFFDWSNKINSPKKIGKNLAK